MSQQTEMKQNSARFKIKLSSVLLKELISTCAILNEEIEIIIYQDGLEIRVSDPRRIAMTDINLDKSHFKEWEVIKEGKFSVKSKEFLNIVKKIDKEYDVSLSLDNDTKLKMLYKLTDNTNFELNYNLIDTDIDPLPLPKLNSTTIIDLNTENLKQWKKTLKDYKDYEDILNLSSNKDQELKAKVINTYERKEKIINLEFTEIKNTEKLNVYYPLEYIIEFLKCIKDHTVSIYTESDHVMLIRVSYQILPKRSEFNHIDFYLAPNVDGNR